MRFKNISLLLSLKNISVTAKLKFWYTLQVQQIGGVPENIYDLWEITGKRPEAKFTWDTYRNDNLNAEGAGPKFKVKCRFDRLYLRNSTPKKIKTEYFELIGIERLKSCQRFCSDHWGLLAHFKVIWSSGIKNNNKWVSAIAYFSCLMIKCVHLSVG